MKSLIYLDNAATTPVNDEVLQAMLPYFSNHFGNPSSLHTTGQNAHKSIEDARKSLASMLGVTPNEIIFTGSGTESDNIAIIGTARKLKKFGNHIITSNIEHPAVRNTVRQLKNEGFEITEVPVQSNGIISVNDIEKAIRPQTILISIMYANNEIGTIQPVGAIAELADLHDIIFHTDAVQIFGKLKINLSTSKIHLLSASGHKIMGPKGIGLLYVNNSGKHRKYGRFLEPILFGGGHEFGLRPATENVPAIIGFVKAFEISIRDSIVEWNREKDLRDDFIQWVLRNIPYSYLNGDQKNRLANNINLRFSYIEGESLLLYLNQKGYEMSTGSACSSQSLEPSHVLLALGIAKADAHGSLRITLGKNTTQDDLNTLKPVLKEIVIRLREMSPLNRIK